MTAAALTGLQLLQRLPVSTDNEVRHLLATPEVAAALDYCHKAVEHHRSPHNQARLAAMRTYKEANASPHRRRYNKDKT